MSRDRGCTADHIQAFLHDATQQGDTFIPGKGLGSTESRSQRVNSTIQAVDQQFPNLSATQQNGHGSKMRDAPHTGTSADVTGVGQQFQD